MSPSVGDEITFELTKPGSIDATDFSVSDLVQYGFGGINSISHGGTIDLSSEIVWQISSLPVGESLELTFDAIVLPP